MANAVVEKLPAETFSIGIDFTGNLPAGVALHTSGSSAKVYDSDNADVTTNILSSGTATIDIPNNIIKVKLKAEGSGADAQAAGLYLVRFSAALANSDVLQDDILLLVKAA